MRREVGFFKQDQPHGKYIKFAIDGRKILPEGLWENGKVIKWMKKESKNIDYSSATDLLSTKKHSDLSSGQTENTPTKVNKGFERIISL